MVSSKATDRQTVRRGIPVSYTHLHLDAVRYAVGSHSGTENNGRYPKAI